MVSNHDQVNFTQTYIQKHGIHRNNENILINDNRFNFFFFISNCYLPIHQPFPTCRHMYMDAFAVDRFWKHCDIRSNFSFATIFWTQSYTCHISVCCWFLHVGKQLKLKGSTGFKLNILSRFLLCSWFSRTRPTDEFFKYGIESISINCKNVVISCIYSYYNWLLSESVTWSVF